MTKPGWLLDAPKTAVNRTAGTPLYAYMVRMVRGENLSIAEAEDFFAHLSSRESIPEQIAGSLVALVAKGETPEELAGMARMMNRQSYPIKTHHQKYIDITGTGSSTAKTFNVSTAAALVTAGAGLTVAKHSSRAVTSNTGSADVISQLDVNISGDPKLAQACLNGAGISFMFAPKFHPTLRRVGDVKRSLGLRTTLNLLGVLSNPSNAPFQLIGVWHPSLIQPMAEALAMLRIKRAWVVYGEDGLDELTISGKTLVAEVYGNKIRKFELEPESFGLHRAPITNLHAPSPQESAKIILDVLESRRRDSARSLIVINAAAALLIGGKAKDAMQAARLAEQSIDSGSARIKLDRLIQTTNKK
ncbi:MAG: anthranilate phosphoribosyltransferase [Pyrinomonadaceae bacterium]